MASYGDYEYAMAFENDNAGYADEVFMVAGSHELDNLGPARLGSPTMSEDYKEQLIQDLPSNRLMTELSNARDNATARPKSVAGTIKRRKTVRSRSLMYKTVRMRKNTSCDEILQKLEAEELIDEGYLTKGGTEILGAMPVSLSQKRAAMRTLADTMKANEKTLSWDIWLHSHIKGSWIQFKRRFSNMVYYIALWKSAIKKVEGLFGSSVTSYFLFLKWLFYLNMFTFFLMFCFQVLPQLLYRFFQMDPSGYKNNTEFEVDHIFNGKGWMSNTEMFYGFYTNHTIILNDDTEYLMPYAYFYSSLINYLLILSALFYSIAQSYKVNYIEAATESNYYFVTKIFSIWDYNVTSRDAAALRHMSIINEMKEHLSGFKNFTKRDSHHGRVNTFFKRLLIHIIVLGMISGSGCFVYYLATDFIVETTNEILKDFAVPMSISVSNLLLPLIFTALILLEGYEHPQTKLYVTMVRSMLLSITNLVMLCLYWMQKIVNNIQCWETFISQEIYRLVIVDFFFTILYTIVFELIWSLLHFSRLISTGPKFNIATTTLDLIYSQALCWLGLFYAPLMPLLMVVKLFFIFYIKWCSVVSCCSPSKMIWRASRTHTVFLGTLLIYFVLTVVAVAVSVNSNKPSSTCGPFTHLETAYDLVSLMVEKWQSSNIFLKKIVQFISQRGFIFIVLLIFCAIAYYSHIILVGHRKMVTLLKYQLDLEGKNKQFLLTLMNKARQTDMTELNNAR